MDDARGRGGVTSKWHRLRIARQYTEGRRGKKPRDVHRHMGKLCALSAGGTRGTRRGASARDIDRPSWRLVLQCGPLRREYIGSAARPQFSIDPVHRRARFPPGQSVVSGTRFRGAGTDACPDLDDRFKLYDFADRVEDHARKQAPPKLTESQEQSVLSVLSVRLAKSIHAKQRPLRREMRCRP